MESRIIPPRFAITARKLVIAASVTERPRSKTSGTANANARDQKYLRTKAKG